VEGERGLGDGQRPEGERAEREGVRGAPDREPDDQAGVEEGEAALGGSPNGLGAITARVPPTTVIGMRGHSLGIALDHPHRNERPMARKTRSTV
jgi:hypothetical protein